MSAQLEVEDEKGDVKDEQEGESGDEEDGVSDELHVVMIADQGG